MFGKGNTIVQIQSTALSAKTFQYVASPFVAVSPRASAHMFTHKEYDFQKSQNDSVEAA